ncbi:2-hydroxyacyl-CoA dehydratase subunit D [uncultured Oscillibacter sp.]|uniref:2-hydroxyacyl-CoA dehydratase subunit D n=1 Tax=uncultured Oscillibacter sp. TaxID=876091 RepID=UPI0025CDB8D1|nr:2-hydroxyacyl-CoA dehydratase family protein [uncultured Oscillibacter sp.]
MNSAQSIIDTLCEKALHPDRTVAEACKQAGKEAVGFYLYAPEELVYAAGFLPVGIWGGSTEIKLADRYLQGFCCSIMRADIEYGMRGTYNRLRAVMLPTVCDTLKCICENWKVAVPQVPIIPVVYPQNRTLPSGEEYLRDEFSRVRRELEDLAGQSVSDAELEAAFAVYETWREAMRAFTKVASTHPQTVHAKARHLIIKAGYFMDKAQHTREITELTHLLAELPEETCAVRAVATGLVGEPLGVLDSLRENGVAIVADDLAQESRQFRVPARAEGDALSKMVWRIADQKGCPFLYEPEKTRGQKLIDLVKENKADAVITLQMKFCDPDEFDYPIYKAELEAAGIPLLYLEVEQQMDSFGQIGTRIQSLAEMLL